MIRIVIVPGEFKSLLQYYTELGYRVLAVAHRPLKLSYTKVMKVTREELENDLTFLGLLIMENRLKPDSKPVINELLNANLKVVMVTGE